MDKKFLTFLVVISLQQFQVTLGQLNVEVTFTVDSSTTTVTTATLNWTDSESNFTDITYSISIEPSGPTFDTSSGGGSLFNNAASTGIAGLSPGVQYNITVIFTHVDNSTQSFTVGPFNAAPKPPTNVMVTAVDTETLNVSWMSETADNTQDSFVVYTMADKSASASCGSLTESSTSCTFAVTGNPGESHTVYVVSVSGISESEVVPATGNTKPGAPTSLGLSNLNTTSVDITWVAATNSTQDEFFYSVTRTSDHGEVQSHTLDDAILSKSVTNLVAGEEYIFSVQAKSNGVFSETLSQTFTTKPASLSNLQMTTPDGPTTVTITWDLDDTSIQDDLKYTLVGSSDTGTPTVGTLGNTSTSVVLNTSPGEIYTFTIYAVSNNVLGAEETLNFTTKPLTPTITIPITRDTTSATVIWTAGLNSQEDKYVIELTGAGTDKGEVMSNETAMQTMTFSGLASGFTYTVNIMAKRGDAVSDVATQSFVTVPLPPTSVAVSATDTSTLVIMWVASPSPDNKQDTFLVYIDTVVATCGPLFDSSTTCTNTVSGNPGQQYTIEVKSKSMTEESTGVVEIGNTKPLKPTTVTVAAVDTDTLMVTWVPVTDNNIQSTFVVYRDGSSVSCSEKPLGPSSTTCTFDVTENPGTQYTVNVVSKSGTSESIRVEGTGNTKPPQIDAIALDTRTVNQLKLRAEIPTNSVIDDITVSVVPISSDVTIIDMTGYYLITIDNLTAGTNYDVEVTTVSGSESGASKTETVSTKPAPPTSLIRKSATTNSMLVGWAAPAGNYDGFSIFSSGLTDSTIGKDVFEITIPNLDTAGKEYQVTLLTRSNELQSDPVVEKFRIKPNSPKNIQFTGVTDTSFTVTWVKPDGEVTGYSIANIESIDKDITQTTHTFVNLEPGSLFSIIVTSKADTLSSEAITVSIVTLPKPARSIQIGSKSTTEVSFSWAAPEQTFAVTGYRYTLVARDGSLNKNETTTALTVTEGSLYAGQTYDIKVWAYTDVGGFERQESSQSLDAIVTLEPNPPTLLTVTEKTTRRLRVTWTNPTNTLYNRYKYKVYKTDDTNPFVETVDPGTTQLEKTNLEPGFTYNVDIWTQVDDSNGGDPINSATEQIVVTMVPDAPVNIMQGEKSRTTIDIVWEAPSNNQYDAYQLTVTDTSNGATIRDSFIIPKGTVTVQQTGLIASRTYKFKLVSVSGSEISSSVEVDILTNSPSTPDLTISEASPSSIDCDWAASQGEVATNARVQVLNNGIQIGEAVDYSDGTSNHTFTGLKPGQYYTVEVVLTVDGANSEPQMKTIVLSPLPVSNFMISVTSATEVELTWVIDSNSYQNAFVIDNGEKTYMVDSGSTTNYAIGELGAGRWYEFLIHAKAEHSSKTKISPDVSSTVTTYPLRVKTFNAVADDHDTVTLTWEPDETSNQTSYKISFTSLSAAPTPSTSEYTLAAPLKTYVVDNLHPGAGYSFSITTLSGGQESENERSDTVRTFPLAPETLTISAATTTMTVSWNVPQTRSIISDYIFEYTEKGVTNWKEVEVNGNDTSKTVSSLVPGQNYTVRIFGISSEIKSQTPAKEDVTLVPEMRATMAEDEESTRTNEVVITYSEEMGNGVFDKYIFSINAGETTPVHKAYSDTDRVVRFSGLTPGTLYIVRARTHSGDQKSSVQTLQVLTVPGKPTITCSEEQPDEIAVLIGRPSGGVTNYVVNCNGLNCESPRSLPNSTTVLTYQPLIPFNSYTFDIAAVVTLGNPSRTKTSSSSVVTCNTVESAPEQVASFDKDVVGYDVTLTWTEPTVKNGRIRNYTLSYIGTKENNPTKEMSQTLDATQLSYEFTNLIAGYTYTFVVLATTVKPGPSREIIHFFPILEPSIAEEYIGNRDAMKPKKTGPEPSETEFVIQLVNPFTDKNGKIKSYSVIVATSDQDLAKDTTLLKWSKAQEGAFESPYIAINECPDLFEAESKCHKVVTARRKREAGPTIEITIGGDQSCTPETTDYCNGKLSPNTNYYVLLRAYTETGLHADTPFSGPILTAPKDQTILIAVVCAVVAALIFIIVIVLVVILVRRKKRKSDDDPGTGMGPVSHKSSFKEPEITSIPVKIDKFDEHVTHMSADSDFRFAEEYEDLKQVGRDQSWSISELPVNRPKNRFTNILPYDHSRVKLLPTDDEEGSDYINANWMPGYNSKREFIVTQGALPATTDDFWRMMWEQNSRAIVMLTKCVERGREKCHHYWPVDSEPIFYGDLQVTVLNETKDPEWVITEFKLAKGEISRKVLHFHYTAWPDFDVPEKPQSLINFVRIVRGRVGIHGGPITVHCSAGVGRSGTYICIDRLLQVIQNTDVVDIYGIVYEMRRERCFMVQTERQYICIHQCLLCVIKGEDEDPENVYENGQVNPGFEEDDGIVMD